MQDAYADRTVGEEKPRTSVDEGPSMTELSGYNSKRREFEIEYENDAEQLLADMLIASHATCSPLGQRVCYWTTDLLEFPYYLMCFSDSLLTSLFNDRGLPHKIKEAEETARGVKESSQPDPSGKFLQRANNLKGELDSSAQGGVTNIDSGCKDSSSTTAGLAISNSLNNWDVTGFVGANLLSVAEKQLCGEIKILPTHYLSLLEAMSMEILKGNITKKSEAHGMFNLDPNKVDGVYDMLVKKGITQA
ncbi:unnamed protein product [Ilex paraguariensis]|uniref:SWIRM domain-containing protein n=1 Tax=Ilex paraguariensis TaxID=185542 RepID=A0ABC8RUD5_9AQUA